MGKMTYLRVAVCTLCLSGVIAAVCFAVSAQGKAVPTAALALVRAGACGVCCDANGTWTKCPPEGQTCGISVRLVACDCGGARDYGVVCSPEGGSYEYAPAGAYNAECEDHSRPSDTCEYSVSNAQCAQYSGGTCDTSYMVEFIPCQAGVKHVCWLCKENGGLLPKFSHTRVACSGTDCTAW